MNKWAGQLLDDILFAVKRRTFICQRRAFGLRVLWTNMCEMMDLIYFIIINYICVNDAGNTSEYIALCMMYGE